jgi:hypothetical protein
LSKALNLTGPLEQEKHLRRQSGRTTLLIKAFQKRVRVYLFEDKIRGQTFSELCRKTRLANTNRPFDDNEA